MKKFLPINFLFFVLMFLFFIVGMEGYAQTLTPNVSSIDIKSCKSGSTVVGSIFIDPTVIIRHSGLSANITVTTSANVTISRDGTNWVNSAVLDYTTGSGFQLPIRFASSVSPDPATGSITFTSPGATPATITVTGEVVLAPVLTVGTLGAISSSATSFNVPYNITGGTADKFFMQVEFPTIMSGFTNIPSQTITSPLSITIPPSAPANYGFGMTVFQSGGAGCASEYVKMVLPVVAPSSNKDLSSLTISSGSLGTFSSSTLSYNVALPSTKSTITFSPTAADPKAIISINGSTTTSGATSAAFGLLPGLNVFNIKVTAEDGSNQTYVINVTRNARPPVISSFSPISGPSGTTLTINGTNLDGITAVKIGTIAAASFTINSSTSITAVVDHGETGKIEVSSPLEKTTSTSSFTYLGTLPLSFVSFKSSSSINNVVRLEWEVADANNCKLFVIERSEDGTNFKEVGSVTADQNARYQWHEQIDNNIKYYRILVIENSNLKIYSSILKVGLLNGQTGFIIYPNPVIGQSFNITPVDIPEDLYEVSITNLAGKIIY